MRSVFLPFALPELSGTEATLVNEVLSSGWITSGPKVREFERLFAERLGARYAVVVNSCTAAMHLALEAVQLSKGDEVITTPYTFAATAEVIRYFNGVPVFVDVDPVTFNVAPAALSRAVTERTKAIIPIHIGGFPADLDEIISIAQAHNLKVIEDAAHAFPSKYNGRMVGSISDFTCFSFYATKTITTGEGGMICTNNQEWAERCKIMSLHGISRNAWNRYAKEGSWYYEIIAPGFKYNMTDVAAAMGIAQLARAESMWKRRCEIAARYNSAFSSMPELQIPADDLRHQHSWHLYMLRLNLETLTIGRAEFIEELKKLNIGTSVHFIPLHIHPYYRETYGYSPHDFPVAYREYLREISLPIYSKMTDGDVQDVIDAVRCVVETSLRGRTHASA